MSSKTTGRRRYTLAFRLTLWYAGVFTLSTGVAFLFFYYLITTTIRDRIDGDLQGQLVELRRVMRASGVEGVKRVAILEAQAAGEKKIFIRLLYPSGVAFSSSNMSYWENIGISRRALSALIAGGPHVLETVWVAARRIPVRVIYGLIGPGVVLQTGQSMEHYFRIIETFRKTFIATLSILILAAALVGWFLARRALTGVANVTRTARRISAGSLEERVPLQARGDEIDQLALTFNGMLDRIQRLVTGIKEMNDNIAHDLKSPVTRIRGAAEIALTTGRSLSDYQAMAASTIEECDRLLDMINTMLVISRTEAGVDQPQFAPLDLAGVARDACELFSPIAEDKGIDLIVETPPVCKIKGDNRMIQRLLANLVDNALKYTPAGGRVTVMVAPETGAGCRLSVKDTGDGIQAADLPHIFERFFRCDQSRTRSGAGLGLSLALAIAHAHGTDIRVKSAPAAGSTFSVRFDSPDARAV
jgi:heavy metal sensor kinase